VRGAILLLLVLLLPFVAVAEEEEKKAPAKDPVKALPKCLQPGVTAVYDRAASGKTLAGTVTYRIEADARPGSVKITLDYDTGDRGVLTFRDRLTARLNAKSKRLVFEYAVGAMKDDPLLTASRLVVQIDKKLMERLIHERLTYGKKGEKPRVKRTRVKVKGAWVPELLEPFLAPLHYRSEKQPFTLKLMSVLTGTIGRKAVQYRPLGEGSMRIGEKSVDCRILSRVRGDDRSLLYLRKSDSLPLKAAAAGLTLRPPKVKKPADREKKDK